MNQPNSEAHGDLPMHKRRITMEDGRYMIFYTFGEQEPPPPEGAAPAAHQAPPATPEAEEERNV